MAILAQRPLTTPTPTPTPDGVPVPAVAETRAVKATRYVLAGLRLALGWTFLWAFLDKLFGFGFATEEKAAWINGGSPTEGFLKFAATGPFQGVYNDIAGQAWADWLFMLGLLGVGLALTLGIGVRIAAAAGGLLLILMWTAVLPPENNPFMDDHPVYAGILAVVALTGAGNTLGFGRYWRSSPSSGSSAGSGDPLDRKGGGNPAALPACTAARGVTCADGRDRSDPANRLRVRRPAGGP